MPRHLGSGALTAAALALLERLGDERFRGGVGVDQHLEQRVEATAVLDNQTQRSRCVLRRTLASSTSTRAGARKGLDLEASENTSRQFVMRRFSGRPGGLTARL